MGIARKLADLLDNDGDVKLDKQRPAYAKPTNENINYISGLQSALNDKVDDIQVLTNVPTGALFTDTVYTHPTNHAISEISGLQSALDGKTTEAYVNTQVAGIVNTAPATLDTLNELAQALGDDPNYATTTSNLIGTKAPQSTTYTKTETDAKIVALSPPATKAHVDSLNVNAATLSGIASTSFARKDATNFGDFGISGIFFGGALEVSGEVNANTLRGNLVGTFNNIDSSELLTLDGGTLTGNLSLGDNVKANFGAGNDLQIHHDGSHSYITDAGTGSLRVRATDLNLANLVGNNYLNCVSGGAVTAYHNNVAKLATTSTGIDVTGQVNAQTGKFGKITVGYNPGASTHNRVVLGWANVGGISPAGAYYHIKTGLWAGDPVNNDYIMGGFEITGYRYVGNSANVKQLIQFHNWSGSYHGWDVTSWGDWHPNNNVYTSSDGYVCLRLQTSSYWGYNIDLLQYDVYTPRQIDITESAYSNNTMFFGPPLGSIDNPFTSITAAQNEGAAEGLHWFINNIGQTQELYYYDGFVLVSSNWVGSSTFPLGNSKNNLAFTLHRNGALGNYGSPSPTDDYLIGAFISNFNFSKARIATWGAGASSAHTWEKYKLSYTNVNTSTYSATFTWNTSSLTSITHVGSVTQVLRGPISMTAEAQYAIVDAVRMDSGLNANPDQSTIGGAIVINSNGDPSNGCYIGHGSGGETHYGEGSYLPSNTNYAGYTTWVGE